MPAAVTTPHTVIGRHSASCGLWWPIDHLRDAAVARAAAIPVLERSIRGGEGNDVGALGELVAIEYLEEHLGPGSVRDASETTHDLSNPAFGTFDVKTKERSRRPLAHYDCTVPDYVRAHQRPDWYLFVSLTSDGSAGIGRFTDAWILGTMLHERFDSIARFWRKGEVDASNGWPASIDCWNVPISELRAPRRHDDRTEHLTSRVV